MPLHYVLDFTTTCDITYIIRLFRVWAHCIKSYIMSLLSITFDVFLTYEFDSMLFYVVAFICCGINLYHVMYYCVL